VKRNVRELVEQKRQWQTPPDDVSLAPGFRGWHSRGYLPHFDQPGVRQLINYRLADSMPASLRHEWESLMKVEDDLQRFTKIEDYLDRGLGECELRDHRAASIVEENWLHLDGESYRLLAWVVMPNHVHLLVEIWQVSQSQLVKNWKGYSARRINEQLGREGELWQEDYWDRYIRDEAHYRKVVRYIESNPVKAGLAKEPRDWPFSSARFRDDYENLQA
jgi:REP element-mobilizing transposase RayT